jgi:hypothetical protein
MRGANDPREKWAWARGSNLEGEAQEIMLCSNALVVIIIDPGHQYFVLSLAVRPDFAGCR